MGAPFGCYAVEGRVPDSDPCNRVGKGLAIFARIRWQTLMSPIKGTWIQEVISERTRHSLIKLDAMTWAS